MSRKRNAVGSRTDRAFDQLLPEHLRHLSPLHWTPVDVAIRATALLCPTADTRVLDVGSGAGKLCAVGALTSAGMWCGVERHAALVDAARDLAQLLGVAARTLFLHGDAFGLDWGDFDAIYLYNPFATPPFPGHECNDGDAGRQIALVQDRLATLPALARVVTFHGFGGVMPSSFELVHHERQAAGPDLVLWVQRSSTRDRVRYS